MGTGHRASHAITLSLPRLDLLVLGELFHRVWSVRFGECSGGKTIGESIQTLLSGLDVPEFFFKLGDDFVVFQPGVFALEVAAVVLLPTELADGVLECVDVMSSKLAV